jgi:signal transduction histidine kinase
MWWLWAAQMNPFLAEEDQSTTSTPVDGAVESLSKHGLQACCAWSPVDGFYQFSENWAQVTGQLSDDCMGEKWPQSWHPAMKKMFEQAVADMFSAAPEDRTDSMVVEGDIMRGDGHWATLELAMIASGARGAQKLTLLVCDVSEQRNMQQQVALAELQSQAVEHCRSSFLSNMSHELRTPLNAIMGFAQMLEQQQITDTETAKDYLRHIRMSGEELLTKISDLIELASIDAGQSKLHEEPMNVSEAIDIAIEMQSHKAFEKKVALKQQTSRPHLVMMVDRSRLLYSLAHLLNGAIERSHAGGVVEVCYQAELAQGIEISVYDHGTGMTQRHLQNLRTSLQRLKSYYHTDIEDISIGLAVCKEAMEMHGGRLHIDSLVGRGTVAALQFPSERIVSLSAKVKRKSKQFG